MAKVSKDDVQHLARLARIAISTAEAEQITNELDAILGYVEQLQNVDTKDIKPTNQVTGLSDVWRKDEVKPSPLSREQLLANTPHTKDGYIKVKKVL
jgi:aspartyl-tRNA(Asn)/glutamyl-tRNA(Gln) amidotransferase subunit C